MTQFIQTDPRTGYLFFSMVVYFPTEPYRSSKNMSRLSTRSRIEEKIASTNILKCPKSLTCGHSKNMFSYTND